MNQCKGKIFYLQLAVLLILQTGAANFAQNLNATVTVNNNPSEDYLFIALSFSGVGNLWIVDNNLTPVFYKNRQKPQGSKQAETDRKDFGIDYRRLNQWITSILVIKVCDPSSFVMKTR
jgi:hypothetical protein